MKYALAIALLLVLLMPNCSTADSDAPDRAHSIVRGAYSAQVDLKTEAYPISQSGLNVAFKRHGGERSALRLGVHYRWRHQDESRDQNFFSETDGELVGFRGAERSYWRLAADLLWIGYPAPGKLVNLYWGLGPSGGYSSGKTVLQDRREGRFTYEYSSTSTEDTWFVGGTALLGIEWFAIEKVSLYMEYRASVEYSSLSGEDERQGASGDRVLEHKDRESWEMNSSAVLIGLAAYF
jgi:opacity protein-like surface antigen